MWQLIQICTHSHTHIGALETLGNEIHPNTVPAAASPQYRKSLAISLFYKVLYHCIHHVTRLVRIFVGKFDFSLTQFYLVAIGGHISPAVRSASVPYKRPVSQGTQSYSTEPSNYPVSKPMTKLTALLQVETRIG